MPSSKWRSQLLVSIAKNEQSRHCCASSPRLVPLQHNPAGWLVSLQLPATKCELLPAGCPKLKSVGLDNYGLHQNQVLSRNCEHAKLRARLGIGCMRIAGALIAYKCENIAGSRPLLSCQPLQHLLECAHSQKSAKQPRQARTVQWRTLCRSLVTNTRLRLETSALPVFTSCSQSRKAFSARAWAQHVQQT